MHAAEKATSKAALALHDARGTAKRHVDAALAGDAAAASVETDRLLRRLAELEKYRREQILQGAPPTSPSGSSSPAPHRAVGAPGHDSEDGGTEDAAENQEAAAAPVVRVVDVADVRADALRLLVDEEAARIAARDMPPGLQFVDPAAAAAASSAETLSKRQLAAQRFEEWRQRKAGESQAAAAQRAADVAKKAARAKELREKSAKAFREWMREAKSRYGYAKGSAGPPMHDARLDSYAHAASTSVLLPGGAAANETTRTKSPRRSVGSGGQYDSTSATRPGVSGGPREPFGQLEASAAADDVSRDVTLNVGTGSGQVLASRSPQTAPRHGDPAGSADASRASLLEEDSGAAGEQGRPFLPREGSAPPSSFLQVQRFSGSITEQQQRQQQQPRPPRSVSSDPRRVPSAAGSTGRGRSSAAPAAAVRRGHASATKRPSAAGASRQSSYPHPKPWVGIEYEPPHVDHAQFDSFDDMERATSSGGARASAMWRGGAAAAVQERHSYSESQVEAASVDGRGGGQRLQSSPQRRRQPPAAHSLGRGSDDLPFGAEGFDEDAIAGTLGLPPSPTDFESSRDFGRALLESKGPRGTALASTRPDFVIRAPAMQSISPPSASMRPLQRLSFSRPLADFPLPSRAPDVSSRRPATAGGSSSLGQGGVADGLAGRGIREGSSRNAPEPALFYGSRAPPSSASRSRATVLQVPGEPRASLQKRTSGAIAGHRAPAFGAGAPFSGVRPATVATYVRGRPGSAGVGAHTAAAATRRSLSRGSGRQEPRTSISSSKQSSAKSGRPRAAAPPRLPAAAATASSGRPTGLSAARNVPTFERPFRGFEAEIGNRTVESDFVVQQGSPGGARNTSGLGPGGSSIRGGTSVPGARAPLGVVFGAPSRGGVEGEVASAMAAMEDVRRRRLARA